jgi:hypothetical protein
MKDTLHTMNTMQIQLIKNKHNQRYTLKTLLYSPICDKSLSIIPINPLFIRHKKKTACSFVTNYLTWRPRNTRQFVAMLTRNSVNFRLSLTACIHTHRFIPTSSPEVLRSFNCFDWSEHLLTMSINWNWTDVNNINWLHPRPDKQKRNSVLSHYVSLQDWKLLIAK